jgi:hypothetical protein
MVTLTMVTATVMVNNKIEITIIIPANVHGYRTLTNRLRACLVGVLRFFNFVVSTITIDLITKDLTIVYTVRGNGRRPPGALYPTSPSVFCLILTNPNNFQQEVSRSC